MPREALRDLSISVGDGAWQFESTSLTQYLEAGGPDAQRTALRDDRTLGEVGLMPAADLRVKDVVFSLLSEGSDRIVPIGASAEERDQLIEAFFP